MLRSILIFGFLVVFLVLVQYSKAQSVDEVIESYVKARGVRKTISRSYHLYGRRPTNDGQRSHC
jgi:preprotein translocase subunit SecG